MLKNKSFGGIAALIAYVFVLIFVLMHIDPVLGFIGKVVFVMMPFVYGLGLAYIINWIFVFFEHRLPKKCQKHRKTLSLIMAYSLVLIIFALLIFIIGPQLIESIISVANLCIAYFPTFLEMIEELFKDNNLESVIQDFINHITGYLKLIVSPVMNFTIDFGFGVYNICMGFIISIYFVGCKKSLISQFKRIMKVSLPERVNKELLETGNLFHNVFGKYLKGKILEALIVGVLCFIGMTILQIPYALLISVINGFGNIIPFFGPFLGMVPSILILLVIDPIKALWFTIFILILQQIDGNLIGPKVVGNSVGLTGIFIIFSVLLGGALFGIIGMILGVPAFAVVYRIIKRVVTNKERTKEINKE